jgi:uncharacterized membrane protein YccC
MLGWLRAHDRGFAALRRAGRTAIVMPALFAIGLEVIGNPVVATFAVFGSFAMLLLVDFGGPMRYRLRNQLALAVACAGLIALATVVSRWTWPAAATTGVVAFGILFAGVASSVLASATQPLLLSFILSVCLPGTVATIPDRLAGWGLASACSLVAIAVLWPAPERDPVRTAAIAALRALAARVRGGEGGDAGEAQRAMAALGATFYATPFRPTGLSTAARSVVRLVDELRWLEEIAARPAAADDPAARVVAAVADVLDASAALLDAPASDRGELAGAAAALRAELGALERSVTETLLGRPVVSADSPGFRAQELAYVALQVAANTDAAAAAERRSWAERLLGRQPAGLPGTLEAAGERAGAHLDRQSVWLRNSVRGGIGLAGAVLVAELSSTQHAFWVVLGALSVLRSNALTTGQTVVRAIGGTAVGLVVGGTLVWLIGTDRALLWVLLPFVILAAGLAPSAVSFAAGQAAFTLTVLIVFNILEPAGWRLGLVRIEDVALGCGVSLLVGLLLWPRGAGAVLSRALSAAYRDSAAYLAAAVDYGVARCDARAAAPTHPAVEAARAAASSRRLDDAFRGYLGERGDKPVAMADVTRLVTGVVGLRLAADAVLDLWREDGAHQADRAAVRRELEANSAQMASWYGSLAESLEGHGVVPEPLPEDEAAADRLVDAAQRDLRSGDATVTSTAVRVLWTADHLDAARRLEEAVARPAREVVAERALR